LEADLQTKESEANENRHKHLATQQVSSFLLASCIGENLTLSMSEEAVRAMIAAERPEIFHEVSGHRYWHVLPLQIPGVRVPQDTPKTECGMALKLHSLLSNVDSINRVSAIIALISNLLSRLPSSEFYPITAVFKDIWELTARINVSSSIGGAILCFSIRQLGLSMRARFGSIGLDGWDPFIPAGSDAIIVGCARG
jgi:hypothetical protein